MSQALKNTLPNPYFISKHESSYNKFSFNAWGGGEFPVLKNREGLAPKES